MVIPSREGRRENSTMKPTQKGTQMVHELPDVSELNHATV